jgi:hypothetical protein
MSTRLQVVFDASDPHELARFWAKAVRGEVEDHSDIVRQLVESGAMPRDGVVEVDGHLAFREVAAVRADGLPRLFFQLVPEPKVSKNRCHIDLLVGPEQADGERDRLLALGAVMVATNSDRGPVTHTLRDPQGNEFCVS